MYISLFIFSSISDQWHFVILHNNCVKNHYYDTNTFHPKIKLCLWHKLFSPQNLWWCQLNSNFLTTCSSNDFFKLFTLFCWPVIFELLYIRNHLIFKEIFCNIVCVFPICMLIGLFWAINNRLLLYPILFPELNLSAYRKVSFKLKMYLV